MSVDLVESLTSGKLDFIVVPDSFWRPGFKAVPLANVQNAWMCSPELMYERGLMKLEDLAKFPILTQGTDRAPAWSSASGLRSAGCGFRGRSRATACCAGRD